MKLRKKAMEKVKRAESAIKGPSPEMKEKMRNVKGGGHFEK